MQLLTVREVATMLRYSEKHIRRMCKEAKIPYSQNGEGRITFSKEIIESWWTSHHQSPVKTKIEAFKNLKK